MIDSKILYTQAVEAFGTDNQMNMVNEECGELTVALNKYRRGLCSTEPVAEEIADVLIMLEQLTLILDCAESVSVWKEAKLYRLDNAVKLAKDAV